MASTGKDDGRITARTLIPLLTPPFALTPPAVKLAERYESMPESAPFRDIAHVDWTVSTHIFPAAWPRCRHRSVQGRTHRFELKNAKRPSPKGRNAATAEAEWLIEHQNAAGFIDLDRPETYSDQDQLWVAVNRYIPAKPSKRGKPGYTLVLSHATGLHKESCEPILADLLSSAVGDDIDEIWALDCVNQGDSALLNRDNLGDAFSWTDSGRDICNFLLQYLPPQRDVSLRSLPYVLSQQVLDDPSLLLLDAHPSSPLNPAALVVPSAPSTWRGRHLVGSGHSLGGGCTTYAAASLPLLFTALIYCDPITPPASQRGRDIRPIAAGALSRRDHWPSLAEAERGFSAKKDFFGLWAPPVLKRYVHFALCPSPSPNGGVELKGRKRDEALVFADTLQYSDEQGAGARVAFLPAWLRRRTHFVYPAVGRSVFPEDALKDVLENAKGATSARLSKAGHLVIQEAPDEVAREFEAFLKRLKGEDGRKAKL